MNSECRNCGHGSVQGQGYGCITCTLKKEIYGYGAWCKHWTPLIAYIQADQICSKCGEEVMFRDVCNCGSWGAYEDKLAEEFLRKETPHRKI